MKFVFPLNKISLLPVLMFLLLAPVPVEAALTVADCAKCHDREPRQIAASGQAHKAKVTCLDCHESHRPLVANNIPDCSKCHGKAPHQGKIDCSSCHAGQQNCKTCHQVHQPYAWTGNRAAQQHCKVCHPAPFSLLKASTSKHHDLDCAFCHREHGYVPKCSECHGLPHGEGTHSMFPQCSICHNIAHDLNKLAGKK